MPTETYLTHYLWQSVGWVKVAEYACATRDAAERLARSLRDRYPSDVARFDIR